METKVNNSNQTLLDEFLTSLIQVPIDLVNAALKHSQNEDEKTIIEAFASTITNQFKEISNHIRELSNLASKQKLAESEQYLRITSANTLYKGLKIALPSIGSIIGKLGIDGIIKEIKKIIEKLAGIFGWNLDGKLWQVILLIDEIISDILSGGLLKVKNALSQAEQNYLAELTSLAKLEKASMGLLRQEDEDEN